MSVAARERAHTALPALGPYLADLAQRVGRARVAGSIGLVLLCTVFESVGLLALVPLLQLLNGQSGSPALSWLLQRGFKPELGTVLALFVGLMLIRSWLARRRDLQLLALRLDYVDSLRHSLEAALAAASWRFLARLRHAEVMHVLYDQLMRINQGTNQVMQLLSGWGLGLASLVVASTLAPLWILALVVPVGLLAWALRRRLGLAGQMGARLGQGQLELMASSKDFLGGLKLVKAHAIEGQHVADLRRRTDTLRDELFGFASHQSNTRGWFEIGSAVLLAGLLYGAATWAHTGLAELLLLVLVFSRLLPVLRDSQLQMQQLAHMMPAFHATQDWIRRCQAASEGGSNAAGEASSPAAGPRLPLRQHLRFEDVTLRYQDSDSDAVAGLNLVLQAGTSTALIGASGSGKTTLADMALGLLTPTAGAVFVDGVDLSQGARQRQWRASVAYVAQDTYLFPASIRDNLCWLAGKRPDSEIWHALDQAAARDFVAALAAGLDHPIGERGEGLSGGQRQRLALARALLCKPELLVLDEVTSQLDPDSESRVLAALAQLRGQMTILSIAHRAAAVAQADRVVTLEAGQIVSDSAG